MKKVFFTTRLLPFFVKKQIGFSVKLFLLIILWICAIDKTSAQTLNFIRQSTAGSSSDEVVAKSIGIDAGDNVYQVGYFKGTATFGTTTLTSAGAEDIFIVKYDASGNFQWAKRAGGTGVDKANDIAVSGLDIYVSGEFNGTANFNTPSAIGSNEIVSAGSTDIFLGKYNTSGELVWIKRAGGSGQDLSRGVAISASRQDVFITGDFILTANFNTPSATGSNELVSGGGLDVFVAKFSAEGVYQWSRRAGGTSHDSGNNIVLNNTDVYITGTFAGTANFNSPSTSGSNEITSAGSFDIFIAKYNLSGALQWVRRAGGANEDKSSDIAIRGSDIYIVGIFNNTANFNTPSASGSNEIVSSGGSDVFVAKYNSSGVIQWARRAGGRFDDECYGISTAGTNIFITGRFNETANFNTPSASGSNEITAVSSDIFFAKYNTSGVFQWANRAGGLGEDFGNAIVASDTYFYFTGYFTETANFNTPSTTGTNELTAVGAKEFFLAKYKDLTSTTTAITTGNNSSSVGSNVQFTAQVVPSSATGTVNFKEGNTLLGAGTLDGLGYARFNVNGFDLGTHTITAEYVADTNHIASKSSGLSVEVIALTEPKLSFIRQTASTGASTNKHTTTDATGNVYVTGLFNGTLTFGNTILQSAGEEDIFIAKYNAAGVFQWAKRAGGTANDNGNSIAISGNDVYITGIFNGTANFNTPSAIGTNEIISAGSTDIFLAKYDGDGNFIWVKKAGGTSSESSKSIAVLGNDLYITGEFLGTSDFNTTGNAAGNILTSGGFNDIFIARYNSSGELQWVKKAGGLGVQTSTDITISGTDVYITGHFYGTSDFNTTGNTAANILTSAGSADIFIARYNSSGELQWVKKAGGTGEDIGRGIAVSDTELYVTGSFSVVADFNTSGNSTTNILTCNGNTDIFVARYDTSGELQWVKRGGGSAYDSGYDIAIVNNNVYVLGFFQYSGNFSTPYINGIYEIISAGSADIVIARYNNSGEVIWLKRAGGTEYDNPYGIVGSGNNIYIAGLFSDTANFNTPANPGSNQLVAAGSSNGFLAKYDISETTTTTTLTSNNNSASLGANVQLTATLTPSGATGTVTFKEGSTTLGTATLSSGVAKFNTDLLTVGTHNITAEYAGDGSYAASTSNALSQVVNALNTPRLTLIRQSAGISSGSSTYAESVATDALGNVYKTGYFKEIVNFGTTTLTSVGGEDIFLVKYNASGTVLWAKRAGGTGNDQGVNVAVSGSYVYIVGIFFNTANFNTPSASGSNEIISAGSSDAFVAKFDDSGNFQWAKRAGGTAGEEASGLAISGSDIYVSGIMQAKSNFNNPSATGSNELINSGGSNCFLAKYNSSGDFQWARRGASTSTYNSSTSIAVSGTNVYIAGVFQGSNNFNTPSSSGSNEITSAGNDDIFIANFTTSGDIQWVRRGGGTATDRISAIAVYNNDVYITGLFNGTANFNTPSASGSNELVSAGDSDGFIAKYSNTGSIQWLKRFGGTGIDASTNIALTNTTIYQIGIGSSLANFNTPSATGINEFLFGLSDMFLAEYNHSGDLQKIKRIGGGSSHQEDMVVSGNDLYIVGTFNTGIAFYNLDGVGRDRLRGVSFYESFLVKYDISASPSTTTLTSNNNPASVGANVQLTATVLPSSATGTITFKNGATTIGSATLSSGVAKFNTTLLPVGTHSITAGYNGDDTYAASISSTVSQEVNALTAPNLGFIRQSANLKTNGTASSFNSATDASGNVYITGIFSETLTLGGTTLRSDGGNDILLAKYNAAGVLQWAKRAGGNGNDAGINIAVAGTDVYIIGYFAGTANFNTPSASGSNEISSAGNNDIFIAKYNASGDIQWVKRTGGGGYDMGSAITVLGSDVYIGGNFNGTINFNTPSTSGSNELTSSGGSDIFIAKYTNSGAFQWAKRAGGLNADEGYALAASDTEIYFTGIFSETANFNTPSASGSNELISDGGYDVFVAKYSSSGNLQWLKRAGGSSDDVSSAIVWSGTDIYLTGYFLSTANFNTPSAAGSNEITSIGGQDAFIAKYNPSGIIQWAKRAGDTSNDVGYAITTSGDNIYMSGNFRGTANFNTPSADGSNEITSVSGSDVFVAKYNDSGVFQWAKRSGSTGNDYGWGITASGTNIYVSGSFSGISDFNTPTATGSNELKAAGLTEFFLANYSDINIPTTIILTSDSNPASVGANVQFMATLSPSAATGTVIFKEGNTTLGTATLSNGVATFTTNTLLAGTHSITAEYSGNGTYETGTSNELLQVINCVNPTDVSVDNANICSGSSINLTASCATGIITWYNQATGGSEIGTGSGLTQSPIVNTTYYASCKDGSCESGRAATSQVTVSTPSAPTITASNSLTVCAPSTLTLTASGCAGTVTWSTGSSGTSLTISSVGTYSISATCTVGSCTSVPSETITGLQIVTQPSAPTITAPNPKVVCAPSTLTLTASGCAGAVNWSNGSSGTILTLSSVGTYSISATCTVGGCTSPASTAVTGLQIITQPSVPTITAPNPKVVCAPSTLTLTASGCAGTVTWSTGSSGTSLTLSSVGTYSISATCTVGSCTSPASAAVTGLQIVTQPSAPTITAPNPKVVCAPSSLTLTASGCAGTVTWSNGSLGTSLTLSSVGTYSITATCTVGSCTSPASAAVTGLQIVNQPSAPTITAPNQKVVCSPSTLTLTASGCAGTVDWSNGSSGTSLTLSIVGTYAISATCTVGSCTSVPSSAVTGLQIVAPPTVSITGNINLSCNTTSVTRTANGSGVSPTYQWSDGLGTNALATITSPGTYTVIVTEANNCTATATTSVTVESSVPNAPTVTAPTTKVVCSPSTLVLTASGCAGTVIWTNNSTGTSLTVSSVGTYTISATCTVGSCTSPASTAVTGLQVISQPSAPTITAPNPKVVCAPSTLTLTASGCAGAVTWSTGSTGTSLTLSSIGTYSISATCTVENCTSPASIALTGLQIVTQPSAPTINAPTTKVVCSPSTLVLTASGCAGTVNWSTGATGTILTLSSVGTYSISATCTVGSCTSVSSPTVTGLQIVVPPTVSITGNINLSCNTASVTRTASGSGASPAYQWSNGLGTDATATITSAGTYTVTVTGDNGCTATATTSVIVESSMPSAPTITAPNPKVVCAPSTLTLIASGCAGTVTWSTGATGTSLALSSVGTYSITATCTVGSCTSPASTAVIGLQIITQLSAPTITAPNPKVVCAPSTLTLIASGCAGTVTWLTGATGTSLALSSVGTYSITATCTVGSCTSDASAAVTGLQIVTQPSAPIITAPNSKVVCAPSTLTLTASGCAGTVNWSTGSSGTSLTLSSVGTYSISATCTVGGCTSPASATVTGLQIITQPSAPTITSPNPKVVCAPNILTLTASGCAGTVNWSTGASGTSLTLSNVDTYSIIATCTIGSCTSPASTTVAGLQIVTQPSAPTITAPNLKVVCSPSTLTLTASGCAGTVNWSTGAIGTSLTLSSVGTYSISATCTVGSCTSVSSPTVTGLQIVTPPTVTISGNINLSCTTASVTRTASGSGILLTYQWSNGLGTNAIATITSAGTYTVTVTGANNCTAIATTSVTVESTVPDAPTITAPNPKVVCAPGTLTLTASGCAGTVNWSNGSSGTSLTLSSVGTYSITATCTVGSCTSPASTAVTDLQIVSQPSAPTITAPNPKVVCSPGTLTLIASGCAGTVNWSNGSSGTSLTLSSVGTYSISATCTVGSCASVASTAVTGLQIVTQPSAPTITAPNPKVVCAPSTLTLTASGCAGTVTWSNGSSGTSLTLSSVGTYSITATCTVGICTSPASSAVTGLQIVTQPSAPTVTSPNPKVVCAPGTLTLTASGCAGTVAWSNGSSGISLTLSSVGTYSISATCTVGSCTSPASAAVTGLQIVTQPSAPTITAPNPKVVCAPGTLTLTASGCAGTVTWSNGSSGISLTLSSVGTYSITATCTVGNCTSPASAVVTGLQILSQPSAPTITAPNPKVVCAPSTLTLIASGCTGTVNWSNGSTGTSLVLSSVGTYSITATCTVGSCTSPASTAVTGLQIVTQPSAPIITAPNPKVVCAPSTLTLKASGCAGAVNWSTGASGSSLTLSSVGTYSITATCTVGSCTSIASTTVTGLQIVSQPLAPTITAPNPKVVCAPSTLTLTASGCAGTVNWSNGSSGTSLSLSSVGTYSISATCTVGSCTSVASTAVTGLQIVNQPSAPTITAPNPKVVCAPSTLTLTASGCAGTVTWSNSSSGTSLTLSSVGTYSISATCTVGSCTSVPSETITGLQIVSQPSAPTITAPNPKVVCAPSTLTLTASGCAGTVTWSNGSSGTSLTLSSVGTYSITATCTVGSCTSPASTAVTGLQIVTQPSAPTITAPNPKVVCAPSTLTLTASGCAGTVNWSTGASGTGLTLSSVGTYSISATCTVGSCTSVASSVITGLQIVTQPSAPTITAPNPKVVCAPNTLTLTASGCAGTVNWSTGAAATSLVLSSLGTYSISATCTVSSCTSSISQTVTGLQIIAQPSAPTITAPTPKVVCAPNTLTLTASGCGGIVNWSNGGSGTSITLSSVGTYSITATCTLGSCTSPSSNAVTGLQIVNQPSAPNITAPNPKVVCAPNTLTLTASGCGGTVNWSNGGSGTSITLSSVGTYSITATCTVGSCTSPASTAVTGLQIISQPSAPTITTPNSKVVCAPNTLTLTASGCGGTVNWSNGGSGTSLTLSSVGTYSITATCTVDSCTSPASLAVTDLQIFTQPSAPTITAPNPKVVCSPGTLTLTASGCGGTVNWSNGGSGTSLTLSSVGTYSITATCTVGSCISPVSQAVTGLQIVAQPSTPTITALNSKVVCAPNTLTLTASGCAGTVNWSNGGSGTSITLSSVGTYSITATCTVGTCTSLTSQAVTGLQIVAPPTVIITGNINLSCNIASVTRTANGSGVTPTYQWSNGLGTDATATISTPGTYTVTVTGDNGCTATATTSVTVESSVPSAPTITAPNPKVVCAPNTLTLTASGCAGTVNWSNGGSGTSITLTNVGTYSITAICTVGSCTSPSSTAVTGLQIITQPAAPTVNAPNPKVVCSPNTLILTASGCRGGVNWSNGSSGTSLMLSSVGTYSISATCTVGNCTSPASTTVTGLQIVNQPSAPTITAPNPKVVCAPGTLTLTGSGCAGTVTWSTGAIGTSLTLSSIGTYSITATCTVGICTSPASTAVTGLQIVSQPSAPIITAPNPKVVCAPSTLTLTASGCAGTVTWSNGSSGTSLTLSSVGTYSITATCTVGSCTSVNSTAVTGLQIVTQPSAPTITAPNPKVVCAPSTLTLTASGCAGIVTWSTGATGTSLTLSSVGTYSITATCTIGSCTSSASTAVTGLQIVTQPSAPTITVPSPKVVCAPSTLTLTASGCAGTVNWSTGATGTSLVLSSVGTYSISATCTVGSCTSPASTAVTGLQIVTQPAAPTITAPNPKVVCAPSTLLLTASGCAGTVTWSNGSSGTSLTLSSVGTYSITATCTVGSCISPASTAVTGLQIVTQPSAPTITAPNPKIVCSPSTLTLTASGCAGTVTWSTSSSGTSLTLSSAGTYSISATCTVGSCTSPASAEVTGLQIVAQPSSPIIAAPNPKVVCAPSTLTLTASGCAGTVNWSNGSTGTSLTLSSVGTYSITATCTVGSCTSPASTAVTGLQIVTQPSAPTITAPNPKVVCAPSTLTLTASGCAGTVNWSNSSSGTSLILSSVGTYSISATCTVGSCTSPASTAVTGLQIVTQPSAPTITAPNPKVVCAPSTLTLTVSGCAGTVTWSTSSSGTSLTLSSVGTYSISATCTVGNCTSVPSTTVTGLQIVTQPSAPTITAPNPKVVCAPSTLTLTASGCAGTVNWSNGSTGISLVLSSVGTYSITATCTVGSCTSPASTAITGLQIVSQPSAPTITTPNPKVVCAPSTLTLTASGCAGTVNWSTGASGTSLTLSSVGTYSITATCTVGSCTSPASTAVTGLQIVTQPSAPIITAPNPKVVCAPNTLTLTASGCTGTVTWSNSASGTSLTLSSVGAYSISATCTVGSCTSVASAAVTGLQIVTQPSAPTITAPNPKVVCAPSTLTLTASGCAGTVNWSTGASGTSMTLSSVGTYSISATCTVGSCTSVASAAVTGLQIVTPPNAQASNTGPYAIGQTIQLNASGGTSYSWAGPASFTSSIQNPVIPNAIADNGGVYTVTVSNNACSATATTQVIVSGIDPCVQVVDLQYVKSGDPYQNMFSLKDGMVIQQVPEQVSIIAKPICPTISIGSVDLTITGPEINWTILQNVEPYAVFDNLGVNVYGRNLIPGTYTMTVTGYAEDNRVGGTVYGPVVTTFTVVGTMAVIHAPTVPNNRLCAGSTVDVTFATTGSFDSSNLFKIQLSDSTGGFTNPVVIGTTTAAGTITSQLPQNLSATGKYLIRVASSNQVVASNPTMQYLSVTPATKNLTADINTGTVTEQASVQINADNKITSPANVTYNAGKAIILNPGFESREGSVFKAQIQGCNN
ncbi:Ig-like domain repeat protein [Emticicia sp. C21]|uniref:Ig-like domain repeat protein n=1 Tax=Emticicia sp. C21 TaxID=2302915 RepID=UPI000E356254|nr:Ig-like domain repeat protein [Emticicia sp. C21]RFS18434.1 Ig-like domain repeat protein [Emticicia sp. C21]